jgi:hypothetical protein
MSNSARVTVHIIHRRTVYTVQVSKCKITYTGYVWLGKVAWIIYSDDWRARVCVAGTTHVRYTHDTILLRSPFGCTRRVCGLSAVLLWLKYRQQFDNWSGVRFLVLPGRRAGHTAPLWWPIHMERNENARARRAKGMNRGWGEEGELYQFSLIDGHRSDTMYCVYTIARARVCV